MTGNVCLFISPNEEVVESEELNVNLGQWIRETKFVEIL